ncbi:PASTA domain-containing protein [Microcoleus sp. herbarium19]|uniref:PASTA domain-containing protein n=1 Tax=unclassified Microcoleus TaxID=2642155 RepID=UPI002FD306BA
MNVASQQLPDLTGKTKLEALIIIADSGFVFKTQTEGGYETFEHPDGSLIHIRPTGEIVRTGSKIKNDRGKSYRRRYDQFGNQMQFIPGSNTHSTGENIII